MSNLENRNEARVVYDPAITYNAPEPFGPKYPDLGAAVAKHRRLNDDTPEGRKAYGQAVHAAIRALQRRELFSAAYERASLPRDTGKMTDAQFMASLRAKAKAASVANITPKSDEALEQDYYRAMLESRGVDANKIEDLGLNRKYYGACLTLWLKAAWNVIKGKRGTPYLAEPVEYVCGDGKRLATKDKALEYAKRVHLNTGIVLAVEKAQPKKRGRPFGSKNKPKLVAKPEPVAEPKPAKPRVPSHYLSTASRVAYHAAM
jgi:hypothetical protein